VTNYAEYNVESVSDFISKVEDLFTSHSKLWFRGHADVDYVLEPSIFRSPFVGHDEKSLMDIFKSKAVAYLEQSPNPEEYWNWLFLMQHHKVPTRLLDWSESAFVGLAFAIHERNDKHLGKGAAVWCLNPYELNKALTHLGQEEKIPNINEDAIISNIYNIQSRSPVSLPAAIIGPLNSKRIIAQKGAFTLFPPSQQVCLDKNGDTSRFLVKFNIDATKVEEIGKQLFNLGITESSLYPELDSIAKEMVRTFK